MSEERFFLPSARRPKPGRPRKYPAADPTPRDTPATRTLPGSNGHTPGTQALQVVERTGQEGSALAWQAIAQVLPRLLTVDAAAHYLGVSTWTIRGLADNGTLKPVRIPVDGGKHLRKLTFDRLDLDAVVNEWKRVSA